MYRMAIITMLAPPALAARLDLNRCTKMALIHDMAELLVGDITPVDGIPKDEKNRRELTTMDYLCTNLLGNVGGGQAGTDIRAIWQEYEDAKTPESIFVHDVDKIELLLQMVEYEKSREGPPDLYEFAYVAKKVETPEVKEWADRLIKEQTEHWQKIGKAHGSVATLEEKRPDHKEALDQYYSH